MKERFLGIDFGTGKVAAVLLDKEGKDAPIGVSMPTHANCPPSAPGAVEQDFRAIEHAFEQALKKFDASLLQEVTAIGITGQMHGVVLWNDRDEFSPLVTWQDARASTDSSLVVIRRLAQDDSLADGYGMVTLSHWAQRGELDKYCYAATIHDCFFARWCGLAHPMTDAADAASWGLFDRQTGTWQHEKIKKLSINEALLPKVFPCGAFEGKLQAETAQKYGLPPGIRVMLPTGDNQAAIYATACKEEEELYLTIGTGAQLSAIVSPGKTQTVQLPAGVEFRPYFNDSLLLCAPVLSGGQSLAWLANRITAFARELGTAAPDTDELYRKLDELALAANDEGVRIDPAFFGERSDPARRGAVHGVTADNLTAGVLFRALTRGVLENLRAHFPPEYLSSRQRIIGNGNAVRRLAIVRALIPEVFGLPLTVIDSREEAALGAARMCGK